MFDVRCSMFGHKRLRRTSVNVTVYSVVVSQHSQHAITKTCPPSNRSRTSFVRGGRRLRLSLGSSGAACLSNRRHWYRQGGVNLVRSYPRAGYISCAVRGKETWTRRDQCITRRISSRVHHNSSMIVVLGFKRKHTVETSQNANPHVKKGS